MTSSFTEKIIGVCFLLAIFTYSYGGFVVESASSAENYLQNLQQNSTQLTIGAISMLVNSICVALIGILLLPILKPHSENIAYGQFAARLIEAVLLIVGIVFLLLQIPVGKMLLEQNNLNDALLWQKMLLNGNFYAYQFGMIILGLNGIAFCYLFFRKKLINNILAIFGMIGYTGLFFGATAELFGYPIGNYMRYSGRYL